MNNLGKQERKLVADGNAEFRNKEEIFNCEICGFIFHQRHHYLGKTCTTENTTKG